ncbi:MAG TPA: sulfite exporter TauE/SafE family protein [Fimbriimonas sp.]|nr:sulfite exporter TauE/SafE family protein [Fimbriimonas sp.]
MDASTWWVLLIAFIASLIRSTFGFGEALVAVPLLALFLPIRTAAPLAVLLSITVAAVVVIQDWRKIHLRSVGWLLGPTILGIPLGIWLLSVGHQSAVKAGLGVLILSFALYSLLCKAPPELHSDSKIWLVCSGFLAGALGGAYGMNGPPLVVYGAMRRWSPQQFRATLQGYFLPASVAGMVGYCLSGLWQPVVTHYYLLALIVAIPAIFLGRWANQQLSGASFLRFVYCGLVGAGIALVLQAAGTFGK